MLSFRYCLRSICLSEPKVFRLLTDVLVNTVMSLLEHFSQEKLSLEITAVFKICEVMWLCPDLREVSFVS
jgi:hypothetical protein